MTNKNGKTATMFQTQTQTPRIPVQSQTPQIPVQTQAVPAVTPLSDLVVAKEVKDKKTDKMKTRYELSEAGSQIPGLAVGHDSGNLYVNAYTTVDDANVYVVIPKPAIRHAACPSSTGITTVVPIRVTGHLNGFIKLSM